MAAGRKVTYEIDVDEKGAVLGARKVEQSFDEVDKKAGKLDKTTSGLSDRLTSVGAVAGGAAAAGLGIALSAAMTRSISKGREFESQLAELEAITGITGNRLERLGDRSLELSKKYGTSASSIVEANKMVASVLAEKIDFGTEEGFQELQQISEQAIILQKAAGTDLASAVDTTTSIINQFNLEASESGRVINTLAAGAKYGAAEVPAIGQALVNAGSAAYGAGQSIETTNAAIQVLAANGQVGERAGTALRAIFTRLKTEAQALADAGIKNVNIEANGLSHTLRQLEPLLQDTTAAKKIFGEEALNQIQILIRNADAVESLTGKVTDTQIAHKQAAVNMNTFDGAADRLTSTLDNELIAAFQEANGVGVQFINTLAEMIEDTGHAIRVINDFADRKDRIANIAGSAGEAKFLDFGVDDNMAFVEAEERLDKMINKTQEVRNNVGLLESQYTEFSETANTLPIGTETWQQFVAAAEEAKQELQSNKDALEDQATALKAQMQAVDKGSDQYRLWKEYLREVEERLRVTKQALSSTTDSVKDHTEAQEESNDASEEQEDKQQTLTTQLKDKKKQLDALITSEANLTGQSWEQAKALQGEITELKDLIELRKKYIEQAEKQELSSMGITSTAALGDLGGDEITNEEIGGNEEAQKKQAEMDAWAAGLQTVELGYQSVAEAAGLAGKEGQKAGEIQQDPWAGTAEAIGQAAGQAILYADSVGDAVKKVIQALTAEIIGRAILAAFNPPTPASLALAPVLAAGATKLITSLIPDFAYGGLAHGPSHAEGGMLGYIDGQPAFEFEGGEAIINKKATQMFLPELSAINQAGGGVPLAKDGALTLNSVSRSREPVPSINNSIDTSAIAQATKEGIESANVVAVMRDSLEDLSERLTDLEEYQNSIGN